MLPAHPVRRGLIFVLASALLTSNCQKSLPTGPSDLTEGLIVYEDDNYRGKSAHVTADIRDLAGFDGPCSKTETLTLPDGRTVTNSTYSWDDCISSVRLAPGWRATLYGDHDFRGSRLEVTSAIPDLGNVQGSCEEGLNDCVSSVRVFRP